MSDINASMRVDRYPDLSGVIASLSTFKQNNRYSELDAYIDAEKGEQLRVIRPWNDDSLSLGIPREDMEVIQYLNNTIFPERLSALYHIAERKLEIIFTAFNLSGILTPLSSRSFTYRLNQMEHECSFALSSPVLLKFASVATQRTTSETAFRNLQSFMIYSRVASDANKEKYGLSRPLSLWISNIDFDESNTIGFVEELNFYMRFYDRESPIISIHPPKAVHNLVDQDRYCFGDFPKRIDAQNLDPNLVSFWNASYGTNTMLAFILYYRITEYALSHYMDDTVRKRLKRLISAPTFGNNISKSMDEIATTFSLKELDDVPKFKMFIRSTVEFSEIWKEISRNRDFFQRETAFEGGFRAKALITSADTEATFCRNTDSFTDAIRRIRNALSHGKDIETAGVILPSHRNLQLLTPWVGLMLIIAGQIILYKDLN